MTNAWQVLEGDCVDLMASMPEASVDAVVCDPPYGLEFMGKEWDRVGAGAMVQRWHFRWATEALRVLKPGGHLLAFGGTRTYHRLACAIEDVGFEIRDTICWLYGSGFPKSLDVGKAIDRAARVEREVTGVHVQSQQTRKPGSALKGSEDGSLANRHDITAPATPEAERWNGWGTALKPAHEPIVVARKPLAGTVAENVLQHGTGALNVDGCRVGADAGRSYPNGRGGEGWHGVKSLSRNNGVPIAATSGRWPANLVLDEEAAAALDEQSGDLAGASAYVRSTGNQPALGAATWGLKAEGERVDAYGDSGGASRFFYVAKAGRRERNVGLEGFEEKARYKKGVVGGTGGMRSVGEAENAPPDRNHHPTVKPVALMRWLVRLVTPPDGLVLDPFVGSGTTGIAAVLEGFRFTGLERESEYVEIARARIAHAERCPWDFEPEAPQPPEQPPEQLELG